jgi:hypothetical protein
MYQQVQKLMATALLQQSERADLHLALAFADAGLGLKNEAIGEAGRAIELLPVSRDALSGSGTLVYAAQVHVRVGDYDGAFDLLKTALSNLSGQTISSAMLKLDSNWDPIRNDPRFAQLLTLAEQPLETKTAP